MTEALKILIAPEIVDLRLIIDNNKAEIAAKDAEIAAKDAEIVNNKAEIARLKQQLLEVTQQHNKS